LVTNGGRVNGHKFLWQNKKEALELSLRNAEKINFEGKYFRKDMDSICKNMKFLAANKN
jgi:phosphoribosylamine--glycine ligase